MRRTKALAFMLGVFICLGAFETVVRVKPAFGQAVGYCGFGRPCRVASLTVGTPSTTAASGNIVISGFVSAPNGYGFQGLGGANEGMSFSGSTLNLSSGASGGIVRLGDNTGGGAGHDYITCTGAGGCVSPQANGSNAIAFSTNGARLDLGTGASDYFYSDAARIITPGKLYVGDDVQFSGTNTIVNGGLSNDNANAPVNVSDAEGLTLTVTNGASGSGTGITVNATSFIRHYVHKITVAENALTVAATTQDVTIWTVPAKTRLIRILVESTVGFTGGGLTNMQVMCGPAAGSAAYLVNGSIFAANLLGDQAAEIGTSLTAATVADVTSMSSTQAIVCRFTSTTANVVAATAGSATFYIEAVTYP